MSVYIANEDVDVEANLDNTKSKLQKTEVIEDSVCVNQTGDGREDRRREDSDEPDLDAPLVVHALQQIRRCSNEKDIGEDVGW